HTRFSRDWSSDVCSSDLIHTPYTTQTGNMHGMPLAMACGIDNLECKVNDPRGETVEYWEQIKNVGIPGPKLMPEDIVYIAVRDLDKPENYLVKDRKSTRLNSS